MKGRLMPNSKENEIGADINEDIKIEVGVAREISSDCQADQEMLSPSSANERSFL
jgi:hypothetical protein